MKIAIIATFLGQKMQGGEISVHLLTKSLNEKKQSNVFAVTSKITQKLPYKCYSMPLFKHIPNQTLIIGHKFIDRYMTKRLIKIFQKEKPSIIHIQDFFMMIPAIKAARKLKIPTVLTVRSTTFACNLSICLEGNNIPYHYSKKQYRHWLYDSFQQAYNKGWLSHLAFPWFYEQNKRMRYWFKKIDYYIAVSEFNRQQIIKIGVPEEKTTTIKVHCPGWKADKKIKSNDKQVFTAGVLTKFKGFDYLIKAFSKVVKSYPDAKLRIAGEGSEKENLKRLTKKLSLTNNVIFLGKISHNQMQTEYQKSSFIISPSIGPESLSRIIFEAFSIKKTVIATDVGGSPELVRHNKTGLLVQPYNTKSMAKAIIELINRPKLRGKLAKNACELIKKESNNKTVIKKHLSVYQKVIKS